MNSFPRPFVAVGWVLSIAKAVSIGFAGATHPQADGRNALDAMALFFFGLISSPSS
jgi:hypothetical protein